LAVIVTFIMWMVCQFFHEVAETEPWMLDEVNELSKCLDKLSLETINQEDAKTVESLLQVRAPTWY